MKNRTPVLTVAYEMTPNTQHTNYVLSSICTIYHARRMFNLPIITIANVNVAAVKALWTKTLVRMGAC